MVCYFVPLGVRSRIVGGQSLVVRELRIELYEEVMVLEV